MNNLKTEDCKKWLLKYLIRNQGMIVEETRIEAKKQGYSKATLKQARKELGVKTFCQFDEWGATSNWFWYIQA